MSLENRKKIDKRLISGTLINLERRIGKRIRQRGDHAFVSRHEILGQITEEYDELVDEVRLDKTEHKQHIRDELFDIAVACVWGILSIDTNSVDW